MRYNRAVDTITWGVCDANESHEGVLIPKQFLEGIDEGEIRREKNLIVVVPIDADDPILTLGMQPMPPM